MAQETLFTIWGIVVLNVAGVGVHAYLHWSLLLLLIHGTPMSKIFIWERGRSWNELMAVSPWVQLSQLELKDWCYSLCSRILWVERDLRNNLIQPPLSLLPSFPPSPSFSRPLWDRNQSPENLRDLFKPYSWLAGDSRMYSWSTPKSRAYSICPLWPCSG